MTFPILQFGATRFLQAYADLFVSEALKRGEAAGRMVAVSMEAAACAYRISVIDRFRNPFLNYRLADIFANHEAEKARRLGGLIALANANDLRLRQPRLKAALAATEGAAASPVG